ncbi:MAG: DUF424 family protein [Candidatus Micrarchaeota archaeon]
MYLKIHNTKEGVIVAACDKNLLGKSFEEGIKCIDLKTYRAFYEGELSTPLNLKQALKLFSSANLVGKNVIKAAIEANVIKDEDVKYIEKVPYVQVYNI